MPTTTWNKRWAADLDRFRKRRPDRFYGDQWGDPSLSRLVYLWRKLRQGQRIPGYLAKVVERHIRPYVHPGATVLEIGAGGGRWTQYLLGAREIVVVELNPEFFPYLEERFGDEARKLRFYETSGYELGGIDDASIDFVFSFGTFVHIDPGGIDEYLGEIRRVLVPGAVGVIQYADRSKKFFRAEAFSDMDGPKMESFLERRGLELQEHDRTLLDHSNIAVFRKPAA